MNDINKIPKGTKVEIEVDTGMHRNGILAQELDLALNLIIKSDLVLNGLFTHFSNAYLNDKSLSFRNKFLMKSESKLKAIKDFQITLDSIVVLHLLYLD